jgi:hypothetical protein
MQTNFQTGNMQVVSMPWLASATKTNQSKTTKRTKGKEVVYPKFQECLEFLEDEYWRTIFFNASYGKFPKSFSISSTKDKIIFRKKNRVLTCEIPNEPLEIISTLSSFFREVGGIKSSKDIEDDMIRKRAHDVQTKNFSSWSEIRKKTNRESLLENFISREVSTRNLNSSQETHLRTLIFLGISNSDISKANIILSNGQIEKIEGLEFDEKKKIHTFSFSMNSRELSSITSSQLPDIYSKYSGNSSVDLISSWKTLVEKICGKCGIENTVRTDVGRTQTQSCISCGSSLDDLIPY